MICPSPSRSAASAYRTLTNVACKAVTYIPKISRERSSVSRQRITVFIMLESSGLDPFRSLMLSRVLRTAAAAVTTAMMLAVKDNGSMASKDASRLGIRKRYTDYHDRRIVVVP